MNQQTLMASLSAYPAPKASDEFLWRQLSQAWLNEKTARHDEESCIQSLMSQKIEKMLSVTRYSWAAR